jgi:hypothetical protein
MRHDQKPFCEYAFSALHCLRISKDSDARNHGIKEAPAFVSGYPAGGL